MPYVDHNPFPGVNPFVEAEQYWDDFHGTTIPVLRAAVLRVLPPAYDIRVEERVITSERSEDASITRRQHRQSDVAVIARTDEELPPDARFSGGAAAVAVASPAVSLEIVAFDQEREKSLAIRRLADDELVTSIELLSPTNKSGKGFETFVDKRRELYAAGVSTVDIDLLRGGRRLAFNTPLPVGDFFAFVACPYRSRTADGYAWTLRDRLPAIRVPLGEGDPDVVVDLAAAYADAFDFGGYPRRLRYRVALRGWDAATNDWAGGVVRAAATT